MERRQIEYFLAVVDHGSFSRAALEIHVTQPALSQGIALLERELGTPLFNRMPRGVVLTPAGKAAVEPARRALKGLRGVHTAVLEVMGLIGGTLDIASLPTFGQAPVSPHVAEFRKRHPRVAVSIHSPSQTRVPEVAELVRQGVCELGVVEGDHELLGFETLPLGEQDYVAFLPVGTKLAHEGRATWEEVLECGLIVGPWWETSRPAAFIDRELGKGAWRGSIAVRTDHREASFPLVVAGAGAAILPRYFAAQAALTDVTVAELTPALWRSAVMIRTEATPSPAARAFWEMAAEMEHPKRVSQP